MSNDFVSPLRGGLRGGILMGTASSGDGIQVDPASWEMSRKGLTLEGLWPVDLNKIPILRRFPYVYFGLQTQVVGSEGSLKGGPEKLGDVDSLSLAAFLTGGIQYGAIDGVLDLKALYVSGFEAGRFNTDLTPEGEEIIGDPCDIETGDVIENPNKGTEAAECRIVKKVGLYHSFPQGVVAGVRVYEWINLDAVWLTQQLNRSESILAPRAMQSWLFRLSFDIY